MAQAVHSCLSNTRADTSSCNLNSDSCHFLRTPLLLWKTKSYLICIINSRSVIGRAPILLQALPYSNSPHPSLLLVLSPWNPPFLLPILLLLHPSKCRQSFSSTWPYPLPTMHLMLPLALDVTGSVYAGRAPLLSSKLKPVLAPPASSYCCGSIWMWSSWQQQWAWPPPFPPLTQTQCLYPTYPLLLFKLFSLRNWARFLQAWPVFLCVASRLPHCMCDSSNDGTVSGQLTPFQKMLWPNTQLAVTSFNLIYSFFFTSFLFLFCFSFSCLFYSPSHLPSPCASV